MTVDRQAIPPSAPKAAGFDALKDHLSREALAEVGDLLASLGVSVAEAAWRGSPEICRLHLLQCHKTLKTGVEILKDWEGILPNKGATSGE